MIPEGYCLAFREMVLECPGSAQCLSLAAWTGIWTLLIAAEQK